MSQHEIDETTSKRICLHMNQDHASTAYGIVIRCVEPQRVGTPCKISNAKLTKVQLSGMTLSYVACTGDVCEMKTSFLPFDPPLESTHQVRPRMIEIHNRVCGPQPMWLVNKPLALAIETVFAWLSYAVLVVGVKHLVISIQQSTIINPVISSMFGSAAFFGKMVVWSFAFMVVAHFVEAIWVAYECRKTLKLQLKPTTLWFLLVTCTGYPITTEFITLRKVQLEAKHSTKRL